MQTAISGGSCTAHRTSTEQSIDLLQEMTEQAVAELQSMLISKQWKHITAKLVENNGNTTAGHHKFYFYSFQLSGLRFT